nr:hypothetical protein [Ancylobacter rudongensis]
MGHVAQHWGSFSQDPARILSVWQGGFAHMPVLWALWPSAHGGQPRRLPPPPPSACCSGAASAN